MVHDRHPVLRRGRIPRAAPDRGAHRERFPGPLGRGRAEHRAARRGRTALCRRTRRLCRVPAGRRRGGPPAHAHDRGRGRREPLGPDPHPRPDGHRCAGTGARAGLGRAAAVPAAGGAALPRIVRRRGGRLRPRGRPRDRRRGGTGPTARGLRRRAAAPSRAARRLRRDHRGRTRPGAPTQRERPVAHRGPHRPARRRRRSRRGGPPLADVPPLGGCQPFAARRRHARAVARGTQCPDPGCPPPDHRRLVHARDGP